MFFEKCFHKVVDDMIFTDPFNCFPTLPNQKQIWTYNNILLLNTYWLGRHGGLMVSFFVTCTLCNRLYPRVDFCNLISCNVEINLRSTENSVILVWFVFSCSRSLTTDHITLKYIQLEIHCKQQQQNYY